MIVRKNVKENTLNALNGKIIFAKTFKIERIWGNFMI